eukprot:evm.model.NODE_11590_length_5021_cov_19.379805.1
MARQLLLNTLTSVFGDLVEGLTEENLKVGVWSGEILLKNLRLNGKAIQKLNLPIDVQHGYIGSFRVSIPWSRLTSESVSVEIENVVLIAKPADPMKWDPEELRRCNLNAKRILLEKATEAARAWNSSRRKSQADEAAMSASGSGKESAGYFAKLATRIADNLFVFLKNVHVRFEDPFSDPTGCVSAGIIIQDFQVQSTNNQWEASFVSREEEKKRAGVKGQVPAIYKKIIMRGFAVYWNTRSVLELGGLPLDALLKEMSKYMEITEAQGGGGGREGGRGGGGGEPLTYIIRPVTLTVRLTHNEDGDPRLPLIAADIELPSLALAVRTEQYTQAMSVKNTFDKVQRMGLLLPFRPHKSVKDDPRAWWHYAYFCVKKATATRGVDEVVAMFHKRRRYIELFEKKLKHEDAERAAAAAAAAAAAEVAAAASKGGKAKKTAGATVGGKAVEEGALAAGSALTEEEAEEFDLLEETMPLDSLIVWRTLVHAARKKQQQLLVPGRGMKRRKSSVATGKGASKEGGTPMSPMSGATAAAATAAAPVAGVGGWMSSWWSGGKKKEQQQSQGRDSSDSGSDADFQDTLEEEELQGGEEDWQDVVEEAGGLEGAKEEDVQEGDISLGELCAQADSSLPATPSVKADTELFSVRLRTTSIVTLFAKRSAPLLELTSSLDLEARQKGDTFSAAVRLPKFALKDLYTHQALFSHIAKAGDHTGGRGGGIEANPSGGTLAQQAVENIARATAVVTSDVLGK